MDKIEPPIATGYDKTKVSKAYEAIKTTIDPCLMPPRAGYGEGHQYRTTVIESLAANYVISNERLSGEQPDGNVLQLLDWIKCGAEDADIAEQPTRSQRKRVSMEMLDIAREIGASVVLNPELEQEKHMLQVEDQFKAQLPYYANLQDRITSLYLQPNSRNQPKLDQNNTAMLFVFLGVTVPDEWNIDYTHALHSLRVRLRSQIANSALIHQFRTPKNVAYENAFHNGLGLLKELCGYGNPKSGPTPLVEVIRRQHSQMGEEFSIELFRAQIAYAIESVFDT